ncbi:MAG: Fe-S cluster assembly protein SufD, partial [Ignavibacteria bacterium]|nr:Fe-S cluster assembly protein SufD [Ignavibacteria bacterium]
CQVVQSAHSRYNSVTITIGGSITRNDLNTLLNGEGAESNLAGLYFVSGEQHVDNHTLIEHAVPNCHSNELYKGILGGKSRGVFNGKVFVKRDAQKTNAYQSNKNILLSRNARIDTKPQLEIFADDVKCTHGATVGQIDDEALFYLQSRGIDRNSAISLLIHGFANDVLEYITIDTFKDKLDKLISSKMNLELQKK